MARHSRAFCVSLAAHHNRIVVVHLSSTPSHCRHPIVVVVLDDVNVDVFVIIVVVIVTAAVLHFHIVVVAIAAIIVIGVVVVAVAVIIDIIAHRRRACCAPWLSIQGIRPKQAKAVLPMAWGWSASPWICHRVADGVARTTSCQRCLPVGNIMVLWRLEERYPTILSIYSFVKLRERRLRHCAVCQYIFRVSRATETLIDNDDKTIVVRRRDAKMAVITPVRSRGHSIGATRSHDLQEATLADHGALADHPNIWARGTDLYQSHEISRCGSTTEIGHTNWYVFFRRITTK